MIYKAPTQVHLDDLLDPCIFLAGTIDNGDSEDWQAKATELLKDDFHIFNPRREKWDPTLKQSIDNPQFREQVEWELDHMRDADIILFNFLDDSKSPITLMELGLHAPDLGKCVVCCGPNFWRRGNVEIICERFDIPLFDKLEDAVKHIQS